MTEELHFDLDDGSAMYCSTLVAIPNAAGASIRPAPTMCTELVDPQRSRRIAHEYAIGVLPEVA